MLAYLMMMNLLMPACLRTHHPSLCPRRTMPVTSGCKMLSISTSEELGVGWGVCTHAEGSKTHPSASTQTIVPAFPHTTSGTTANPLSCLGLAGTGAGTWATASAHGPPFPHVCTPAWPTFNLALGPKASYTSLGVFGIGMSVWLPSPFHLLLLLAAAGSGASHFWSLGSTALDKGSRTHSCTHPQLGGPRLRAGYLNLGPASWAHRLINTLSVPVF